MNTVYTAAATSHAFGRRLIVAAIGTVGITAAWGLAVAQIGSAPAAAGAAIVASPAGTAPVSWCPRPPANPGRPPHLPQVVHASNTCHQGTTSGGVSGPGGGTHDPGDGTIDTGDAPVCVSYEIDCHQPV